MHVNLPTISTINQLKEVTNDSGSQFFSAGAIRQFKSRTHGGVKALDGKETLTGNRWLFITSEQYDEQPRHYAVRMMTIKEHGVCISSIGDNLATLAEAERFKDELAAATQHAREFSHFVN